MSSTKKPPLKVLVIGAGVSGLACARELSHRRYNVLVVEARSRCGGRLKGESLVTSTETETNVDVGGALIHGIIDNPVAQLCDQMGVQTHAVSDCLLLDSNGQPVDPQQDELTSNLFNECLEETFARIQQQHDDSYGRDDSNHEENAARQSFGALLDTVLQEKQLEPSSLFKWHQANLEVSCGASLHNLGYEWNDDEPYGYDGAHVALEPSGKAIAEGLAEGLDILYDSPVQCIRIVGNDEQEEETSERNSPAPPSPSRRSRRLLGEDANVRRSSRSNKGVSGPSLSISDPTSLSYDGPLRYATERANAPPKVHVILNNGKILQADAVVCTLPLGILKISAGKSGHVEFRPPLDESKQTAIQELGCGLLNKCAISFPHVFWQDSEFLGVVDDPPHLILNASIVTGQPVVVFMFGGDYAREVEDLTDVEVMEMCMGVLRKICKATVPEPLDYVMTRWGHDVYSRGAFVYIPPGVQGMKRLEALSEPVVDDNGRPLVLFAGEHTTPYHPSTIHGAFLSGIREAYRLDLTLEPALNQHLAFQPDHLYKKTFSVKRKYMNTTPNGQNGLHPPPRRRRHGVMTLRKRPGPSAAKNGFIHSPPVCPSDGKLKSAMQPPSRLSSRVAKANGPKKAAVIGRERQDDRTLVRAYESYRNWQVIQSKVTPVYGSTARPKSVAQLRTRHQQLKTKKARLDTAITSAWMVPPASNGGVKRINGSNASNDLAEGSRRKSHRSLKSRVMLDM